MAMCSHLTATCPSGVVLSGLQQHTHSFAMSSVFCRDPAELNWGGGGGGGGGGYTVIRVD